MNATERQNDLLHHSSSHILLSYCLNHILQGQRSFIIALLWLLQWMYYKVFVLKSIMWVYSSVQISEKKTQNYCSEISNIYLISGLESLICFFPCRLRFTGPLKVKWFWIALWIFFWLLGLGASQYLLGMLLVLFIQIPTWWVSGHTGLIFVPWAYYSVAQYYFFFFSLVLSVFGMLI